MSDGAETGEAVRLRTAPLVDPSRVHLSSKELRNMSNDDFNWDATPPDMLRLADGKDVPHKIGTPIYNYYDMQPGFITALATRPQKDTSGQLPDGIAWWVDTSAGFLDGSRMCTIEFAQGKGWI